MSFNEWKEHMLDCMKYFNHYIDSLRPDMAQDEKEDTLACAIHIANELGNIDNERWKD